MDTRIEQCRSPLRQLAAGRTQQDPLVDQRREALVLKITAFQSQQVNLTAEFRFVVGNLFGNRYCRT